MAPDLTLDAGGGVRRELPFPAAFAAVDGGDQRHVADLHEIVERLSATGETVCDRADERKVALDHASARVRRIAGPQRLDGPHGTTLNLFHSDCNGTRRKSRMDGCVHG